MLENVYLGHYTQGSSNSNSLFVLLFSKWVFLTHFEGSSAAAIWCKGEGVTGRWIVVCRKSCVWNEAAILRRWGKGSRLRDLQFFNVVWEWYNWGTEAKSDQYAVGCLSRRRPSFIQVCPRCSRGLHGTREGKRERGGECARVNRVTSRGGRSLECRFHCVGWNV